MARFDLPFDPNRPEYAAHVVRGVRAAEEARRSRHPVIRRAMGADDARDTLARLLRLGERGLLPADDWWRSAAFWLGVYLAAKE